MTKVNVEKILTVIDSPDHDWFSPYYVHSLLRGPPQQIIETIVQTVDIYTYFCPRCNKVDDCLHTNAVKNHIAEYIGKN